ncbi:MAG: SGNH/GDSL hydrolase family protein [Pseudomonadota bacterium]
MIKNIIFATITVVVSLVLMVGVGEAVLRFKNASMQNYDIEMWRYSNELKESDPQLGHDHVVNASAVLQSTEIRTNRFGLRGGPVSDERPDRRILFLGASITLGWGVEEELTVTQLLEQKLRESGEQVEVLNAGIGNYNAERYVTRFLRDLTELQPTDIVVHYFLRDAEQLDAGGGNWFLRNSQLAVTLWIAASRLGGMFGATSLEDHYGEVYEPDQAGYRSMLDSLQQLKDYAESNEVRLYMAMVPDVHNLKDYRFSFIHERMREVADELEFEFVDFLPAFEGLTPEDVWAMPGDPHPNALGHELMADALFPVLAERR